MSTVAQSRVLCACDLCLSHDPRGVMIGRDLYRKHQERQRRYDEEGMHRRRLRLVLQEGDLHQDSATGSSERAPPVGGARSGVPARRSARPSSTDSSSSSSSSSSGSSSDSDDGAARENPIGAGDAGLPPPSGLAEAAALRDAPDVPVWVRLLHLLVVWLCAARGLPRDCANMLLSFVSSFIITDGSHPRQVDTVRRRLGIDITFDRFVICPDSDCQEVVTEEAAEEHRVCRRCSTSLWRAHRLASPTPRRFFCYSPVTPFVEACFSRPAFYRAINAWRSRPAGAIRDVYDGTAWGDVSLGQADFMDDYCSLNLAIALDWFEPFNRRGTPTYSIGVISLRIDNLPPAVRNRTENVHVVAILPGPRQSSSKGLDSAMEPLITELRQLYDGRLLSVATDTGPRVQRRVRARIYLALSDMPGRAKLCGFADHNQHDKWCPYCEADASTWVRNLQLGWPEPARDPQRHRDAAHTAREFPVARDMALREHSAAWTPLYRLPYWLSVSGTPVDAMHALHLGACKRFVHGTLIDGKLLDFDGGSLPVVRAIMRSTRYPRSLEALSEEVLTTSGGSPTAHHWAVMTRFLLPLLLASHWNQLWRSGSYRQFTSTNPCFGRDAQGQRPSPLPFVRQVPVRRLIVAAATLARLVHICHSLSFDEPKLDLLRRTIDRHLLDTAELIDPRWLVPNHHALRHLPDHIRRFGPPRTFWFYAHERLNGFLKKANHNNRRGGGLEMAMHSAMIRYAFTKNALNDLGDSTAERKFASMMRAHGLNPDPLDDLSAWRPDKVQLLGLPSGADLSIDEASQVASLIEDTLDERDHPLIWPGEEDEGEEEMGCGTTFDFSADMHDHIVVRDIIVTDSRQRRNSQPGGSQVVVRVDGALRMAHFRHAFTHKHTVRRTGSEVKTTYAVVDVLEHVPWPEGHVLGGEVAQTVGYHLFKTNVAGTRVVYLSSLQSAFLSATARFMLPEGSDDVLFGASLYVQ